MESRIPLSIVLSTPGQRHAIPHATLAVAADSAFFSYLASDDTRLPNHPYLNGRGVEPTEYDTYVGEDVWTQPGNVVNSGEDSDSEGDTSCPRRVRHADLVFDDVVEWLVEQLDHEEWARDGVVVCGRHVVADDAAWAVPSRSPTVYTPREAFMVMRCSCKFMNDIAAQHRERGGSSDMGEITIAKALAGSAAKEMRAFVPYRLERKSRDGVEEARWCLSDAIWSYAGVCQRHTDVCFPSLMAWTAAEHSVHFAVIMERLKKSQLLERTCAADSAFLSGLVSKWTRRNRRLGKHANHTDKSQMEVPVHGFCVLLAVDLLFESASLPVHLLSAKIRLFSAREAEPPSFDGLAAAPYITVPRDAGADTGAAGEAEDGTRAPSDACHKGSGEGIHAAEEEEDEVADEVEDVTSFFRLFRNEFNWNHYVEEMEDRWDDAANDALISSQRNALAYQQRQNHDHTNINVITNSSGRAATPVTATLRSVLSDVKVAQYCVVASEASDLVTCSDTLTKRGLPLELLRPELLQGSAEGVAFLKELSEKLLKETPQQR